MGPGSVANTASSCLKHRDSKRHRWLRSSLIYKADSDWLSFQGDSSIHPPLLLGKAMTDTAMGVGNFLRSIRLASCSSAVEDTRTTKQISSKKRVMPRNHFTGIKKRFPETAFPTVLRNKSDFVAFFFFKADTQNEIGLQRNKIKMWVVARMVLFCY